MYATICRIYMLCVCVYAGLACPCLFKEKFYGCVAHEVPKKWTWFWCTNVSLVFVFLVILQDLFLTFWRCPFPHKLFLNFILLLVYIFSAYWLCHLSSLARKFTLDRRRTEGLSRLHSQIERWNFMTMRLNAHLLTCPPATPIRWRPPVSATFIKVHEGKKQHLMWY